MRWSNTNKNDAETDIKEETPIPLSDVKNLLDIVYITSALLKNEGNMTRAAEELEIGRRTLYDLMEKYGISLTDGKLSIQLTPVLRYTELRAPNIEKYLT